MQKVIFFIFSLLTSAIFAIDYDLPPTTIYDAQEVVEMDAAMNPSGFIFVSWISNENVFGKYSEDYGTTWSSVITLSSSDKLTSNVKVSVSSNNKIVVVWQCNSSQYYVIKESHSLDGGATWSSPTILSDPENNSLEPSISSDLDDVTVVWMGSNRKHFTVRERHSEDSGVNWSSETILSEEGQSAENLCVSINSNKKIVVVWKRRDGRFFRVQSANSQDGGTSWSTAETLSDPGQSANSPTVSINGSNVAVAVWERRDGFQNRIETKISSDSGISWSDTYILSEADQSAFNPEVIIDGSNNIIAVWSRMDGSHLRVQSINSKDLGSSWSDVETLSEKGQRAEDPKIIFDDFNNAVVVWKRMDSKNYRIQAVNSTDMGDTWQTVVELSDSGKRSKDATVLVDPTTGKGIVLWRKKDMPFNIIRKVCYCK